MCRQIINSSELLTIFGDLFFLLFMLGITFRVFQIDVFILKYIWKFPELLFLQYEDEKLRRNTSYLLYMT